MTAPIRLPSGVRDFLPRAAQRRRALAERVERVFAAWGYAHLITPVYEHADVLERGLTSKAQAIRFVEPGTGEVVALRPDITPQIARIAATRMGDIEGPLRLCYAGAVIRRTGGARTQREILQAGVELLGAPPPTGDGEMAALGAEILAATRITPRRLEIGHVGPVRQLLDAIAPSLADALSERLALRDLSGAEALADSLGGEQAALARTLPRLTGSIDRVRRIAAEAGVAAIIEPALGEIETVIASARAQAPAAMDAVDVSVDLGEVDGFPYYTGVRLAGWLDGVGSAVLVGGRYDRLVARYGGDRLATGFAVDIELVAEAETGGHDRAGRGVLVAPASSRQRERAGQLVEALRRRGARAALELGGVRGRARLRTYARQAGFDRVLIVNASDATLLGVDGALESLSANAVNLALRGKASKLDGLLKRK